MGSLGWAKQDSVGRGARGRLAVWTKVLRGYKETQR